MYSEVWDIFDALKLELFNFLNFWLHIDFCVLLLYPANLSNLLFLILLDYLGTCEERQSNCFLSDPRGFFPLASLHRLGSLRDSDVM